MTDCGFVNGKHLENFSSGKLDFREGYFWNLYGMHSPSTESPKGLHFRVTEVILTLCIFG